MKSEVIQEAIECLAETVPAGSEVIVFGSQARGDARPDSDLDVLVVEPEVKDRGAEMVRHVEFTTATNIPVYFCDPHSPWQRGTNENTNGLLRRYLPKGRDLTNISASELRAIERSLNSRPRKTLGYSTPLEKLTEFIALTA